MDNEKVAKRVARALHPLMKYRGYFNPVNRKPEGEYIEIFCSDWNKDHWAFYAYIRPESYAEDLKEINDLIERLNWRDGDVYVELIDRSEGLKELYSKFYEMGHLAHWDTLSPENWEKGLAEVSSLLED